jgi:exopolysaccharide biosynthesis protein
VDTVDRGVLRRSFVVGDGPWAIHVLDVDRRACWRAIAVKGGEGVVGRRTTSELVRSAGAAGAINADFFLFAPPGVPVGAHVEQGRVVAGPAARPVFATDSAGAPWIGHLTVEGRVVSGAESIPVQAWNRHAADGLAYFDSRYGPVVDTVRRSLRLVLTSSSGGDVIAVDTAGTPTTIPRGGAVLALGGNAPEGLRSRLLLLARTSVRIEVRVALSPIHPREAVGGFPVLVRDSAEVAGLDSTGSPTFAPVRHPRTIVATSARGRRLMLIVVDGRQPQHSVGMTLREAAQLTLRFGATAAMNLDGGGSTTMVVASSAPPRDYTVVNRPSDPTGERAVGNALAIVKGC